MIGIDVFLGLDVGKGEHHATAVAPAGNKAFDKRLPNSDPKLRDQSCAGLGASCGCVTQARDDRVRSGRPLGRRRR